MVQKKKKKKKGAKEPEIKDKYVIPICKDRIPIYTGLWIRGQMRHLPYLPLI